MEIVQIGWRDQEKKSSSLPLFLLIVGRKKPESVVPEKEQGLVEAQESIRAPSTQSNPFD